MATNVDRNTCSICLERFRTPKIIDCHHTFCEGCLEDYVKKFTSGNFPCPMCRQQITIPEGGVRSFSSNIYIDNEVNIVDYCIFHKDKQVELYCTECSVAVCLKCFALEHNGHDLLDLESEKTLREAVEQNKVLQKQVRNYQQKIQNITESLETNYLKLDTATKSAKENIQARVEEICENIRQYGEQLCTEITNISDGQKVKLDALNVRIQNLTSDVDESLKLSEEIQCDTSTVKVLDKLQLFKQNVQKQDTIILPDIPEIVFPIFTENNVRIIHSAKQIGQCDAFKEHNFNFNFNLEDVKPDQLIYSPEFKMTEDVSWCVCAGYDTDISTLDLFLILNRHGSDTVESCNVTYSLTVNSSVDGNSITGRQEQHEITSGDWGWGSLINWDELKDPTNGFLNLNNKLSVSATVLIHSIKQKDVTS